MTECITSCLGDEDKHGHITICRPRFTQYIVRVRRPNARRYEIIGRSRSERKAYAMLAEAMRERKYRRGDVLGDDRGSYYEPTMLVEMLR